MHLRRKRREQRVVRPDVAAEEAADEHRFARAGRAELYGVRIAVGRIAKRVESKSGRARHEMRAAVWEHDRVARSELNLRSSLEPAPTAARDENVIGDEMLGLRQNARHELEGGGSEHPPPRSGPDQTEVR